MVQTSRPQQYLQCRDAAHAPDGLRDVQGEAHERERCLELHLGPGAAAGLDPSWAQQLHQRRDRAGSSDRGRSVGLRLGERPQCSRCVPLRERWRAGPQQQHQERDGTSCCDGGRVFGVSVCEHPQRPRRNLGHAVRGVSPEQAHQGRDGACEGDDDAAPVVLRKPHQSPARVVPGDLVAVGS
ncbi:hypothetical protein FOA52_007075 [Chlamydomonas sp. UWO 241]|nr:hypothetical protein FOA52_007075 [Chlamydomonas sp. UWO 241]